MTELILEAKPSPHALREIRHSCRPIMLHVGYSSLACYAISAEEAEILAAELTRAAKDVRQAQREANSRDARQGMEP